MTSLREEQAGGSDAAVEKLVVKVGALVPVALAAMGPVLLNPTKSEALVAQLPLECGATWSVIVSPVVTALGIENEMFEPAWLTVFVANGAFRVPTAKPDMAETPSAAAAAGVMARKRPLADANRVANPAAAMLRKLKCTGRSFNGGSLLEWLARSRSDADGGDLVLAYPVRLLRKR
jgi:hypothetical protein